MQNFIRFSSTVLIFYWERVNFAHVSEIINYGKIKKNMVIYQKEKKRVTIGLFYGNLSNEIYLQKYHKNYPQKGLREINPDSLW